MAELKQTDPKDSTDQKKGSGWVLVAWLMVPFVLLVILTLMSYRK